MDLSIIVFLLVFNAVIGVWEEHEAAPPLEALITPLALNARRSG
jgi:H+-transporting ATPase